MSTAFAPKRIQARIKPPLPRAMILWTALTCAVLLALALQVVLSQRGIQITEAWRDVAAGTPPKMRSAMVWWVIAGASLAISAIVAGALNRFPPPWRRYRALRWIVGAAIVAALAEIAHGAALPEGAGPGVFLITTSASVVLAAVMALIGTFFAIRR